MCCVSCPHVCATTFSQLQLRWGWLDFSTTTHFHPAIFRDVRGEVDGATRCCLFLLPCRVLTQDSPTLTATLSLWAIKRPQNSQRRLSSVPCSVLNACWPAIRSHVNARPQDFSALASAAGAPAPRVLSAPCDPSRVSQVGRQSCGSAEKRRI